MTEWNGTAEAALAWLEGANQCNATIGWQASMLEKYKLALADAIRRPMGVIPDSAVGLVTIDDLNRAETRRAAKDR